MKPRYKSEVWYCPFNEEIFLLHEGENMFGEPCKVLEDEAGYKIHGDPRIWLPYAKRVGGL